MSISIHIQSHQILADCTLCHLAFRVNTVCLEEMYATTDYTNNRFDNI